MGAQLLIEISLKRLIIAGANVLALLQTGVLVYYYVLYALHGDELWYINVMGYLLPWFFIPLLLLVPLALWLRTPFLVILVCISAGLFLLTYGHLYLPSLPPRTGSPTFTVMTYNVFVDNRQVDAIVAEVEARQADIVGMQELTPPKDQAIAEQLAGRYPYSNVNRDCGLFSRFPITECEVLRSGSGLSGWYQYCIVLVLDRPVTVLNLHLRPPILKIGYPFGPPTRLPVGLYLDYHEQDLEVLFAHLQDIQGPLVVMGDFNMGDRDTPYGQLRGYLGDSYRERGWGLGFSYMRFRETGIPVWRIDYVFHSPELVAMKARVGDFGGSDHRPVIVRFGFSRP